jgi:hypothetical protein
MRPAAAPAAAAGALSSASTTAARRSPTRSLPVPAPPRGALRRNGYRIEAGIVGRLREERRALIEAAEVELVERDGRVYELRRLPS